MSKLVLIFGPQAVGKMTVGHELEKVTQLKLFHNHMTIELVSPFFGYGPENQEGHRLVDLFREEMFKAVAKSDLKGMIFTYLWAFDEQSDWDYIDNVCDIFESQGGEIYFVELEAHLEERLMRNKSEHRLLHKPTKRDMVKSEKLLVNFHKTNRANSKEGEIKKRNYIKIDNTKLSAVETALQIQARFNL